MTDTHKLEKFKWKGYDCIRISAYWKTQVEDIACGPYVVLPNYRTTWIENWKYAPLPDLPKHMVVQLWKGYISPKMYPGMAEWPGGHGAEVGIYKKRIAVADRWYPFLDIPFNIEFTLKYTGTNSAGKPVGQKHDFISTTVTKGWWQTMWMVPNSFEQYKKDIKESSGDHVPDVKRMSQYHTIGGVSQPAWT